MTYTSESAQLVEEYLSSLRSQLRGLRPAEVEEIVSEMRAHILDSGAAEPAEVRQVLTRLGRPADLAAEYSTQTRMAAAAGSWSPWVILRATGRWALLGIRGFAAFILAVSGYTLALAFFLAAILKPVFPDYIGLWVGENVVFGLHPAEGQATELLGNWFQPFAVTVSILAFIGTTRAIRWLLRRRWVRDHSAPPVLTA